MEETFYITTAIDYPNGLPHIGHAYEKIVTDIYVRWYKLNGKQVFFSTGLDEHGQKLQQAAEKDGKKPQDFVDEKAVIYKKFCEDLNISYDSFIRTSDKKHEEIAKSIFKKVFDKGDIFLGDYEGNYCVHCESYYTNMQLVEHTCPECKRETKLLKEPAYFFKMGKYQDKVINYIEENPEFIVPETRKNEILSRLKEPLKDLCVSRSTFSWGIPLENDPSHVIYVWFDALINYLSAIDYPDGENYKKFWPADIHVIGKDIIWFHTVIWPAMLFAAEIPLPKQVYVHGFINDKNGEKMSKSKGNVIDPYEMIEKYGVDPFRYYIARGIPSGHDGNFSESDLVARYNNELANDVGNLLMRGSKLVRKYYDGKLENDSYDCEIEFEDYHREMAEHMDKREHNVALDRLWKYINAINAYISNEEPWKIEDEQRLKIVLYNVLEGIRRANILLSPFMPQTTQEIFSQLGTEETDLQFGKGNFSLQEASALFPKKEYEEKTMPLNLKVAEILSVEDHPDADKLYVLKINLGDEKRQIVAGIKKHYSKEDLIGKHIVVVSNLKTAKLRGVESQGMLLAATSSENEDLVRILEAPNASPGTSVSPEGLNGETKQIDFKIFDKIKLEVLDGVPLFNGQKLLVDDKQLCCNGVINGEIH